MLAWRHETKAAELLSGPLELQERQERPLKARRAPHQESAADRSHFQQLPPLAGVAKVCRNVRSIWALPRVVALVSDFADGARDWRVSKVRSEVASLWLLRRLHARELLDPLVDDRFYRDWQFNQLANEAATFGNLEVLKWLTTEYAPGCVVTEAIQHAVMHGHLEVVKWLCEEYPFVVLWDFEDLRRAVSSSHVELVKYLLANSPPRELQSEQMTDREWTQEANCIAMGDDLIEDLFAKASLEYIQWAVEQGFVGDGQGLFYAARAGHLNVVQWFAGYLDRLFKDKSEIDLGVKSQGLWRKEDFQNTSEDDDDEEDWVPAGDESDDEVDENDEGESDNESMQRATYMFPQFVNLDEVIGEEGFEVAKWLHEQNFSWLVILATKCAMEMNASYGEYVKWLHEHQYAQCIGKAIDFAADRGDMELVQWIHNNHDREGEKWGCTTGAMDGAAAQGNLKMVQWLHDNRSEGCSKSALARAIANGHSDVAKWLSQNRSDGDIIQAMTWAAAKGNLDMVKWLFERSPDKYTSNQRDVDEAASCGHLEVLQFLLDKQIARCTSSTMDAAAAHNQLEVVKWLHFNRSEGCTFDAMDEAAENGHLEMVAWLHEHRSEGCTIRAMDSAILLGHLDVVRYLHKNRGESVSPHQIDKAAQNGHFEMVRWLMEHCGHEAFAQCTTDAMAKAASRGNLKIVRYLHENHTEGWTTSAMDKAAMAGNFEIVLFLHSHRSEGCSSYGIGMTFYEGRLEMLRWLAYHYPDIFNGEDLLHGSAPPLVYNWVKRGGVLVKGTSWLLS